MRDLISRGLAGLLLAGGLFWVGLPVQGEETADDLLDLRSGLSFNHESPARGRDNWLEVTVPLRTRGPATSFVDNVRVVLSLATGTPPNLRYYQSEVRIATLQGLQTHNIRFYLPAAVVQRDNVSREPYAWAVRAYANGREQDLPSRNDRANRLNSDQLYQSFLQAAGNESSRNEGVLVPIYDSPFWNNFPNEPVPAFIRLPARSG